LTTKVQVVLTTLNLVTKGQPVQMTAFSKSKFGIWREIPYQNQKSIMFNEIFKWSYRPPRELPFDIPEEVIMPLVGKWFYFWHSGLLELPVL
jgi:hypothetical protein